MKPADIARTLRASAVADIWYDAHEHGDNAGEHRIDNAKAAMIEAATVLDGLASEPSDQLIYAMSQWTDEHPADPELGYSDADMIELYKLITTPRDPAPALSLEDPATLYNCMRVKTAQPGWI